MSAVAGVPLESPMTERLKDFIARHVFHPLEGMTLGDWWSLLRRHRFAIDPPHWPRALVQTAVSLSNSVTARIERWRFGRRIDATQVQRPAVHPRALPQRHDAPAQPAGPRPAVRRPDLLPGAQPAHLPDHERWAAPLADRLLIRRRYQDEVALGAGVPTEDEVALGTMTGLSPYLGWYFPRGLAHYDRYLTFRGVPDEEVARWGHALTMFLKKLTLRHGRPLVLKSPPHTARIRLLLGLFPDARFVHIHRHPYDVFRSTRHMIRAVQPVFRLQDCPTPDGDDRIISALQRDVRRLLRAAGAGPRGPALRGRLRGPGA